MLKSSSSEAFLKGRLQQRLLFLSFVNLLVVALLGVLLRAFPFLSTFPLYYKNILHGHSHFAFCGWVFPVLLSLTMNLFPVLLHRISYHHWRNAAGLVLLSAYGMLLSFPVQGYGLISIVFSTLSIVATVYLALMVWKAAEGMEQTTSLLFLKWGLLYGCLSAIGPFSLGPLVAMGKGNSPLYFDAIYFYLHFQYNGLFSFMVLALLYQMLEKNGTSGKGRKVFLLFNLATIPAYALSVLWSEPGFVFNGMGGAAAALQLAGVFYLLKDVGKSGIGRQNAIYRLALFAFVVKAALQMLSALPSVALLALQNRNYVIAYLHLVLLGFISTFVFSVVLKRNVFNRLGTGLFLFSFVTTETLLVLQASSGAIHFFIPYYAPMLLIFSLFFPVSVGLMIAGLRSSNRLRGRKAGVPSKIPAPQVF